MGQKGDKKATGKDHRDKPGKFAVLQLRTEVQTRAEQQVAGPRVAIFTAPLHHTLLTLTVC